MIQRDFHGLFSSALQVLVHSNTKTIRSPAFQAAIAFTERTLRVEMVVAPQPGTSISRDGQTAVVQAGAAASPNEMVRAADDLKGRLRSADWMRVSLTGASGTWSDFNTANRTAMLKSEVIC